MICMLNKDESFCYGCYIWFISKLKGVKYTLFFYHNWFTPNNFFNISTIVDTIQHKLFERRTMHIVHILGKLPFLCFYLKPFLFLSLLFHLVFGQLLLAAAGFSCSSNGCRPISCGLYSCRLWRHCTKTFSPLAWQKQYQKCILITEGHRTSTKQHILYSQSHAAMGAAILIISSRENNRDLLKKSSASTISLPIIPPIRGKRDSEMQIHLVNGPASAQLPSANKIV